MQKFVKPRTIEAADTVDKTAKLNISETAFHMGSSDIMGGTTL